MILNVIILIIVKRRKMKRKMLKPCPNIEMSLTDLYNSIPVVRAEYLEKFPDKLPQVIDFQDVMNMEKSLFDEALPF